MTETSFTMPSPLGDPAWRRAKPKQRLSRTPIPFADGHASGLGCAGPRAYSPTSPSRPASDSLDPKREEHVMNDSPDPADDDLAAMTDDALIAVWNAVDGDPTPEQERALGEIQRRDLDL